MCSALCGAPSFTPATHDLVSLLGPDRLPQDAKAPGFKEVSALVREPRPEILQLPGLGMSQRM